VTQYGRYGDEYRRHPFSRSENRVTDLKPGDSTGVAVVTGFIAAGLKQVTGFTLALWSTSQNGRCRCSTFAGRKTSNWLDRFLLTA